MLIKIAMTMTLKAPNGKTLLVEGKYEDKILPEQQKEYLKWAKNPKEDMPDWLAEALGEWQSDTLWGTVASATFQPLKETK